jgi:cation:H+ antiporter
MLVTAWAVATVVVVRTVGGSSVEEPPTVRLAGTTSQVVLILGSLGLVGLGATIAVRSLVDLAERVGVPEFVLAFFGASLGTSAPEVAVDLTALARGAPGIALGDALGSSLIDATLSIGVGPLVAPAAVSSRLAVVGSLYALVAVAVVGTVLVARRRHDRWSAGLCLLLYALAYVVVLRVD